MEIILYSNDCPRCKVLKKKLDSAGIDYKVESNMEPLINKGFLQAPALKVNNDLLDFQKAVDWISQNIN